MVQDDEPRGFRNPPLESRFRSGQSGNPAGRPKGSKNKRPSLAERFRILMVEEAYRPIKLSKNGEEFMMPMTQVVIRKLAQAAAKGDARAQAMFFKLVSTSANDEPAVEEMVEEARQKAIAEKRPVFELHVVDENRRPTNQVYRYTESGDIEMIRGEPPSTG